MITSRDVNKLEMVRKRIISSLNPNRVGLRKILGDLEADVMEVLWRRNQATVREVHGCICEEREIAYTTVMTVMTRLTRKKLLIREKDGNAFTYTPVLGKKEFTKRAVSEIVDGLMDGFAEPVMTHLIEKLGREDLAKLEELARLVEARKEQEGMTE